MLTATAPHLRPVLGDFQPHSPELDPEILYLSLANMLAVPA
jgi:hypothetical protein